MLARARCLPLLAAALAATASAQQSTERVSVDASGVESDATSAQPSISDDGRLVAFASRASNLVPGDTNGHFDVFVKDTATGAIERVSVSNGGNQGNSHSGATPSMGGPLDRPAISGDGRYVAFTSFAGNLVPGDNNFTSDIFVFDRTSSTLVLASRSTAGVQGNAASQFPAVTTGPGGGAVVVYESYANNLAANDGDFAVDVFHSDVAAGVTTLASVSMSGGTSNGDSGGNLHDGPDVSADGTWVAFHSDATNLVPGDTGNYGSQPPWCVTCGQDVFVHHVPSGATVRVSVPSTGVEASNASSNPSISADGRFVAFESRANNLLGPGNDDNGSSDIFLHDRDADGNGVFDEPGGIATTRVSVGPGGLQGNAASGGGGFAYGGTSLSADATAVAFPSAAKNLVAGDSNGAWDVFVHYVGSGLTVRANLTGAGGQSTGPGFAPDLARGGSAVAFASAAADLVPGIANGKVDAFVRRTCDPAPTTYCSSQTNSQGCTPSIAAAGVPSASAGAGFVVSASEVLNNSVGILIYTTVGPAAVPFQGGFVCLATPLWRTATQTSGGSPAGVDCSGTLALDFNTYAASGVDPALTPGAQAWAQYWSRDPGAAAGTHLGDALTFALCE